MTPEQISLLPYRPGAGVVLINSFSQVFVGQRIDSKADAWQMPQGGIDEGEEPQTAALRELEEETGVSRELVRVIDETPDWLHYDLPHDLVPRIWKGRFRGQKQKWFLMQFLGEDTQVNIQTDHPEFSAWRWADAADLTDQIVPFKRDLYRSILDEFDWAIG